MVQKEEKHKLLLRTCEWYLIVYRYESSMVLKIRKKQFFNLIVTYFESFDHFSYFFRFPYGLLRMRTHVTMIFHQRKKSMQSLGKQMGNKKKVKLYLHC